MDNNILFKTKKDIEEAIFKLRELEVNEGWRLVCDILRENIKVLEGEILDPEKKVNNTELNLLKWKRRYQELLIDTPSRLIGQLENPEGEMKELDPYDK